MSDPGQQSDDRQRLPFHQLLTLSIYWLGIQTIWGGLNVIILPGRADDLSREMAGTLIAILFVVGAVAPIIIQPTVGVISDYTVTRWGRRKPYIVIGALLDVAFLAGIAYSNEFVAIVAFYFLLQVSSNFAQGPFQGYVPDLVPAKQVGTASGLMGLMLTLGTIAGVGIATVGGLINNIALATLALGVVEVVTMVILVATVDEGRSAPARTRSWTQIALSAWGRDILQQRDVLWLLLVRLLFLGAYNATALAVGYFRRSHGMSPTEADTTVLIATAIVGVCTALAAIPGGRLSDRFGRRPVIWAAAADRRVGNGRRRGGAHPGARGCGLGPVRHRHGPLPLGRLGADVRCHPQADGRALHGDPERGHRDGRAGLRRVRRPAPGPRGTDRRRSVRTARGDGRRGRVRCAFRPRADPGRPSSARG